MLWAPKILGGAYWVLYWSTVASSGLSRVPAEKSVARGSGTLLGHCFVLALQEMPMPLETETWLSVDGQHESWLAELSGTLSGSVCSASSTYIYLIPLQRIVLGNKPQQTVVGNIWRRSIVLPHANSSGEEDTCCMQQFKKKVCIGCINPTCSITYSRIPEGYSLA